MAAGAAEVSGRGAGAPATVVPAVAPSRRPRLPQVLDVSQHNGLRVLVVHRPGVPRVELRLRVPLVRHGPPDSGTRARLVADTLLSGTQDRSSVAIAQELQRLGASVIATADVEVLVVSGSSLAATLVPFLELVAEIVSAATFPPAEVAVERERVAQELRIQASQPGTIAHQALVARLYGRHPYGLPLPDPEAVRRTGAARLRRFHDERVTARGSTLVLVGDLRPARAVDLVERAFGAWAS
ncbi:MAG TPA: pitrilysin family protein, partial [Acidimicrobiales bacterium]|nr:pitrilysin family protein [Acidimicrobiales bacterium]